MQFPCPLQGPKNNSNNLMVSITGNTTNIDLHFNIAKQQRHILLTQNTTTNNIPELAKGILEGQWKVINTH